MPVVVTVISEEEGSEALFSQVQQGLVSLGHQLQIPDLTITIEDRFGTWNTIDRCASMGGMLNACILCLIGEN